MTTLVLDPQASINEVLSTAPDGPLTLILKEGVWREKVFVNRPDVTLISEEGARIDNDDRHGTIRDGKVFNTGDSATFTVSAPNFSALGITFSNSFDYQKGKAWNLAHKDDKEKMDLQAVALRTALVLTTPLFVPALSLDGRILFTWILALRYWKTVP